MFESNYKIVVEDLLKSIEKRLQDDSLTPDEHATLISIKSEIHYLMSTD